MDLTALRIFLFAIGFSGKVAKLCYSHITSSRLIKVCESLFLAVLYLRTDFQFAASHLGIKPHLFVLGVLCRY